MTGGWRSTTIQEFVDRGEAELKTGPFGTQLHASDYVDQGTPVINVRNIGFGRIVPEKLEYISDETVARLASHLLQADDIVFGRKGAVERHAFMSSKHNKWFQGSDCLRLRVNGPNLVPRFLSYCFLTEDHKQWMMNQCSHGATMASLNQGIICRIPLRLPPPPTQQRIVSILSTYDELIENNTRRIKILEEMAQMLYREWFVDFRFPCHEKVRMADSELGPLPEGWSVQPMNKVAEVIDCLHSKKPQAIPGGPGLLLQLSNISDGGKLDLTNRYWISQHEYDLWTSRIELREGDCVVPNIGRIGAASQIPAGINAALGRDLTAIRPKAIGPTYLIEYLMSPYMSTEIALKKDSRVIMEVLNVKGIVRVRVPVPTRDVLDRFEDNARPMRRRIELLVAQNRNLRTTRDLLLPKLISGATPVEAADETAAELTEEIALHA